MLVKNELAGAPAGKGRFCRLIWLSVKEVGTLPFHRVSQAVNIPELLSPACPKVPGSGDLSAWDRVIFE